MAKMLHRSPALLALLHPILFVHAEYKTIQQAMWTALAHWVGYDVTIPIRRTIRHANLPWRAWEGLAERLASHDWEPVDVPPYDTAEYRCRRCLRQSQAPVKAALAPCKARLLSRPFRRVSGYLHEVAIMGIALQAARPAVRR